MLSPSVTVTHTISLEHHLRHDHGLGPSVTRDTSKDVELHDERHREGVVGHGHTNDDLLRHLAQDVIAMAQAGGMPDTYWQTDRRIARACEVLGITPEVARAASARAFGAHGG